MRDKIRSSESRAAEALDLSHYRHFMRIRYRLHKSSLARNATRRVRYCFEKCQFRFLEDNLWLFLRFFFCFIEL
jgi:hypothetical protein